MAFDKARLAKLVKAIGSLETAAPPAAILVITGVPRRDWPADRPIEIGGANGVR